MKFFKVQIIIFAVLIGECVRYRDDILEEPDKVLQGKQEKLLIMTSNGICINILYA